VWVTANEICGSGSISADGGTLCAAAVAGLRYTAVPFPTGSATRPPPTMGWRHRVHPVHTQSARTCRDNPLSLDGTVTNVDSTPVRWTINGVPQHNDTLHHLADGAKPDRQGSCGPMGVSGQRLSGSDTRYSPPCRTHR